eukprot:Selendium_serpulae@DN8384_c0_g1_i1.p1
MGDNTPQFKDLAPPEAQHLVSLAVRAEELSECEPQGQRGVSASSSSQSVSRPWRTHSVSAFANTTQCGAHGLLAFGLLSLSVVGRSRVLGSLLRSERGVQVAQHMLWSVSQ